MKALSRCGIGEHVVEEGETGGAFVVDGVALAQAYVDQQAECEGKVGVQVEVANGLGFAIDLEDEVVLGEVLDQRAFFIVDDDRDVDQACIYVECGSGGGGGLPGAAEDWA